MTGIFHHIGPMRPVFPTSAGERGGRLQPGNGAGAMYGREHDARPEDSGWATGRCEFSLEGEMKRRDSKHGDGMESASRYVRRMKAPKVEHEVMYCDHCGSTRPSRKDGGLWLNGKDGARYCSEMCRLFREGEG